MTSGLNESRNTDHPRAILEVAALAKTIYAWLKKPAIRLAVTLVFLWLIYRAIKLNVLVHDLLALSWWWIVIAELVTAISVVVQVLVWRILLNANGKLVSWNTLGSVYLQGLLFAHVLPGTVCGDAFRLLRTAPIVGEGPAVSSIIASRTAELVGTLATGFVALLTVPMLLGAWRPLAAAVTAIAGLVVCYVVFNFSLPEKVRLMLVRIAGEGTADQIARGAASLQS